MPEEQEFNEMKELEEKRKGSFYYLIQNIGRWEFFVIIAILVIGLWLWFGKAKTEEIVIIGIAGFLILWFFAKKSQETKFINKNVAKRIARETLEQEKEKYDVPSNADIATGACRLQERNNQPIKWHIGVKIETRRGKIKYKRIEIHPFTGEVMGIIDEYFDGTTMPDIIVASPEFVYED